MRILSIDPGSNQIETSTTGVIFLDNAKLVDYWVVPYGVKNFHKWFKEHRDLVFDACVIEEYQARDNDRSRDNSVLDTIAGIQACYPDAILQKNAGYRSDIPDDLLKLLGLWTFEKSHHQDIRAAARLALFYAMRNDIEEVIRDIGRITTEKMAG